MNNTLVTLAVAASLITAQAAIAQPAAPPAASAAKLSIRTSLKALLDNPAAKALLQAKIPKVLAHPQIESVWQEPLENIAAYPDAQDAGLTAEMLKSLDAELAKL